MFLKAAILLVFGFGTGVVTQYYFDASTVRQAFHSRHWDLYRNVTDEAAFRKQAIDYFRGKGK